MWWFLSHMQWTLPWKLFGKYFILINYFFFLFFSEKSCDANYPFFLNGRCYKCQIGCANCSDRFPSICYACEDGYSLFKNNCFPQCPEGFYSRNNTCQLCDQSCLRCDDNGPLNCTACESPFVLNVGACSDTSKLN